MPPKESQVSHMTLSPTKTKNRIGWKRMEVGLECQKAEDKWLSFVPNAK